MISLLREFTKSFAFKIVMFLLVLSFVVFGTNDLVKSANNQNVVTAGKRSVDAQTFNTVFSNYKKNLQQQNGGAPITNEEAVKSGLHEQIALELSKNEAFAEWLRLAGIEPSPKLVVDEIRKIPAFFNSITGQFDKTNYLRALNDAKLTEVAAERQFRDSIAAQHINTAATGGLKVPKIMAALQTSLMSESRNASMMVLDPRTFPMPADPSPKELVAFYNEKKSLLKRPEIRRFTIVTFSPAEYMASIPMDTQALMKLYQFKRDTLSKPELRSFIQINTKDAKTAQLISEALKTGQNPQTIADKYKATVVTYDQKPLVAISDAKVGTAAFAMKQGDVSGPVTGDLSTAVLKMGDIVAGSVVSFEAARPQLEADYRKQQASAKVYALVDELEKMRNSGIDLVTAAKKLNAKVTPLPPMSADGQGLDGRSYAQFDRVIKIAFDQPKGGESEVEDMGNGEYFALKVDDIAPSQTPALDLIKPQLIQAFKASKMQASLETKANEVVDRLKKGERMEAIAAEYKAQMVPIGEIDQQNVGGKLMPIFKDQNFVQGLAMRLFSLKKGEAFNARIGEFQFLIAGINQITPGTKEKAVAQMPMTSARMTQYIAGDIQSGLQSGAGLYVKTSINKTLAAQALGVTPPADPAKADKKSAK